MAGIDGPVVRILREKDGYSGAAFAEKLGISHTYLSDIEVGRRTLKRNPSLISKIADTLNVPRSVIERRGGEAA